MTKGTRAACFRTLSAPFMPTESYSMSYQPGQRLIAATLPFSPLHDILPKIVDRTPNTPLSASHHYFRSSIRFFTFGSHNGKINCFLCHRRSSVSLYNCKFHLAPQLRSKLVVSQKMHTYVRAIRCARCGRGRAMVKKNH